MDKLHHQAHLTHNHFQLDQMTTTRYRVDVLVPIVRFLIALPLFQKVLGKNITGYLDTGHRDLRGKVGIQGKVEIPVVPIEHMPVVARLRTLLGRVHSFAWPARANVVLHRLASLH